MPTISRRRGVGAPPEEVWDLVSDPYRLPQWWPGVARVEEASHEAWTTVLTSATGKSVRADYTRVEARPPELLVWRHEVAESPFERILSESVTAVALEPDGEGGTDVELTVRHRPRGFARFGFVQMRMATARQLEQALDGLEAVVGAKEA
ncbi:MAG TPA: SRPBCC domain-containing protein [Thermoleophilaceae bacterium]|nr:SRPBCC domain-containing protein [Thermoleophilaceae bacterium]